VADNVIGPVADTAVSRVRVHTPDAQVAVDGEVANPLSSGVTEAESPAAVPHAPPIVETEALVLYGNDRTAPFTLVTVTTGAVVSAATVTVLLFPLVDVQDRWTAVTV
jgi:hypothetical protein